MAAVAVEAPFLLKGELPGGGRDQLQGNLGPADHNGGSAGPVI